MDKRTLRRILREDPTDKIKAAARRLREGGYIATARMTGIPDTLKISFYTQKESETIEAYRVFLDQEDYITQDLTNAKPRWRTGKIDSVLNIYWWSADDTEIEFADEESREAFEEKVPDDGEGGTWINRLYRFQSRIGERRLHEKHRKVLTQSEQIAEQGNLPLPDDFENWIRETAQHDHYYILYQPGRTRKLKGFCSHCGRSVELDQKRERSKRGFKGTCPECGAEITYITPHSKTDDSEESVVIAQQIPGGIVFRYFATWLKTEKTAGLTGQELETRLTTKELERDFRFDDGGQELVEWRTYKTEETETWCPAGTAGYYSGVNLDLCHAYTGNLKEILEDTAWKYSGLPEYQEKAGYRPVHFYRYLDYYPEHKYLEYLSKAGMTKMLDSLLEYPHYGYEKPRFNENGRRPEELFMVPKPYVRILVRLNGDMGMLRLLQIASDEGQMPKEEEIQKFVEMYGGDRDLLRTVYRNHMSITKFLNYMLKQAGKHQIPKATRTYWDKPQPGKEDWWNLRHFVHDLTRDWLDYIRFAEELHYNLGDTYYLLPPDLVKAHDKLLEEHRQNELRKEAVRNRKIDRKVAELIKSLTVSMEKDGKNLEMRSSKYMVLLPESGKDLREEGSFNHNCVGTYARKVADRETMILFIRKISDPETPFYTMEYHDGKTIQCRGMHNTPAEGDVLVFSRAVEKKLREMHIEERIGEAAV